MVSSMTSNRVDCLGFLRLGVWLIGWLTGGGKVG